MKLIAKVISNEEALLEGNGKYAVVLLPSDDSGMWGIYCGSKKTCTNLAELINQGFNFFNILSKKHVASK